MDNKIKNVVVKEYEENDDLVFFFVEGKCVGKIINVVVINL